MSTRPEENAALPRPKTTVLTLREKHRRREPISMLTAYDYPMARAVDAAGVDAILVGDSLATLVLGHPNTLSVPMDEMLHHARAVARGPRSALLVGDMPFMSYQGDPPSQLVGALAEFEKAMSEYASRQDIRDRMKGYAEMYPAGRPEAYRVV